MRLTRRQLLTSTLMAGLARLTRPLQAQTNRSILVIGAGMAGLTAAQQLHQRGFSVTVLEGRDRIGGRIWTDTRFGVPLDLGAAWIHGDQGNPLINLAQQAQATTIATDFNQEWLYDFDGRELTDNDYNSIEVTFEQIMDEVADLQTQAAVATSLESAITQILTQRNLTGTLQRGIAWSLASEIQIEFGANLNELSLRYWDADEAFKGNDLIIKSGYLTLLQPMTSRLDIRLNQKVNRISYDDKGVTVTTSQGSFTADYALVTLPLGVLKQGQVEFSPPLPATKQQAISRLAMGTLNKIVLQFPQAFWPTTPHTFGRLETDPDAVIEFFNMQPYHPNTAILVGLVGGNFARTLETATSAEVVAEAMTRLRTLFGQAIPEPTMTTLTQWSTDPFSYGSYSHLPPGASPQDYNTLAEPVADHLFFAGEATHATYPSTVHGAYLSGLREANRIAGQVKVYLPMLRK